MALIIFKVPRVFLLSFPCYGFWRWRCIWQHSKESLTISAADLNSKNRGRRLIFDLDAGNERQMSREELLSEKKQPEEERERLQRRRQELEELISGEKEILLKKNIPVEQMMEYLG